MFTKDSDGCITFQDTSKLTFNQFHLMMTRMNHIGYDFPDETSVREYFDRHRALNKDQSDIVCSVLRGKGIAPKISDNKKRRYVDGAIKLFGLTDEWLKAGYLTEDGKLLDFSEGDYKRVRDHRDIKEIIKKPKQIDNMSKGTCAMIEFMNCGNIRVKDCGFETAGCLTSAQLRAIDDYMFADGTIFIDIMNYTGKTVMSTAYDEYDLDRIDHDINAYFKSLE